MATISELEAKIKQFQGELEDARKRDIIPPQSATQPPAPAAEPKPPLKLDLGCGPNPKEGFEGVDRLPFGGKVKHVVDLLGAWPWAESSVDEAHCSHTLEHIAREKRPHFLNELWRVLKPGARAMFVVPHWNSCRYYGDLTHEWPPISEFSMAYFQKAWRKGNAPHLDSEHNPDGFKCDFDCTAPGYSWHAELNNRSDEYRQFALTWYKEAAQDLVFTLVCRK